MNGKSALIVNSISGAVTNGNLKIIVNGVESGDIPLPESIETIELTPYSLPTMPSDCENTSEVNTNYNSRGDFYRGDNVVNIPYINDKIIMKNTCGSTNFGSLSSTSSLRVSRISSYNSTINAGHIADILNSIYSQLFEKLDNGNYVIEMRLLIDFAGEFLSTTVSVEIYATINNGVCNVSSEHNGYSNYFYYSLSTSVYLELIGIYLASDIS